MDTKVRRCTACHNAVYSTVSTCPWCGKPTKDVVESTPLRLVDYLQILYSDSPENVTNVIRANDFMFKNFAQRNIIRAQIQDSINSGFLDYLFERNESSAIEALKNNAGMDDKDARDVYHAYETLHIEIVKAPRKTSEKNAQTRLREPPNATEALSHEPKHLQPASSIQEANVKAELSDVALVIEEPVVQRNAKQSITNWMNDKAFQYDKAPYDGDYGLLSLEKVRKVINRNGDIYQIRWHDTESQQIDIRLEKRHEHDTKIVVNIALKSRHIEVFTYIDEPILNNAFYKNIDAIYELVGYLNRTLLLGAYLVNGTSRRIEFWCPLDCSKGSPTIEQLDNCIYEGYEQVCDSYSLLWNTTLGYMKSAAIRRKRMDSSFFGVSGEKDGSPALISAIERVLKFNYSLDFSKGFLSHPPKRVVKSFDVYTVGVTKATFHILDWGVLVDCLLPAYPGIDFEELNKEYIDVNKKTKYGSFEVELRDNSVHYRAFLDFSGVSPDDQSSGPRIFKFIGDIESDMRNASSVIVNAHD